MLNKENKIAIYNLADIDSVISAGKMVLLENDNFHSYPICLKIPQIENCQVFWFNVFPTKETQAKFINCEHFFYFANNIKFKNNFKKSTVVYGSADDLSLFEDMTPELAEDLLATTFTCYNSVFKHENEFNFTLSELIYNFKNGKKMELAEQAKIYYLYNLCLNILNKRYEGTKDDFDLPVKKSAIEEYEKFIQTIKRRITTLFEYTEIKIDNRYVRVPLINVNQDITPWVHRFLSSIYNFVVTYEQQRHRSVYSVYSKIAGFDEVILRHISDKNGNLDYTA